MGCRARTEGPHAAQALGSSLFLSLELGKLCEG